MPATADQPAYSEFSTVGVPVEDAFAYWRELLSTTFVQLVAEPVGDGSFRGRIEKVPCGDVELSTVAASGQIVRRTRTLIDRGNEEYVLASIQLEKCGRIEQDGRIAVLTAGAMAFYDSTRPYSLQCDEPCSQLVVQVPKRELSIRDTRQLTARTLGSGTPGTVVSTFLMSLRDAARDDAAQTAVLFPHAVGLLSAAASFASSSELGPRDVNALVRQQVSDFLHRNFADSRLDAHTVAQACNVSRRSLYRVVGDEGVAGQLRRIRIERAKQMLVHNPARPIGAVATACGFDSESGFHRAFRELTGQTPGDYRQAQALS
ncbi:AraC family transcriptional regulator [Rhodococcus wratislaviensis]|uniref:AraC family transcriptional regulator n=1 Tax=Rhodococcus wratislaviensis TaxID=44752 RepID=UPI0036553C0A